MSYIGAIAVLILTPTLWFLSHKYFRFIYFGNIGNAILKELLECLFISLFLVSVLGGVIITIFKAIGGVLGFVLKVALIGGAICLALWLVSVIVRAAKGKSKEMPSSPQAEQEQTVPADTEAKEPDAPKPGGGQESERSDAEGMEIS